MTMKMIPRRMWRRRGRGKVGGRPGQEKGSRPQPTHDTIGDNGNEINAERRGLTRTDGDDDGENVTRSILYS